MIQEPDFDFYVNLYLKYIYDVDEMALEKKKSFLRNILAQTASDTEIPPHDTTLRNLAGLA